MRRPKTRTQGTTKYFEALSDFETLSLLPFVIAYGIVEEQEVLSIHFRLVDDKIASCSKLLARAIEHLAGNKSLADL